MKKGIPEMEQELKGLLQKNPYKMVISNPYGKGTIYKKIVCNRIKEKAKVVYQMEKYTDTQVFHENLQEEELYEKLYVMLSDEFKQMNAWTEEEEYSFKISKKKKLFVSKKKNTTVNKAKEKATHNRQKNYILQEGMNIPPLVEVGVFTKDGKVVNSMYDKYRQINRFVEMVEDVIKHYKKDTIRIIDFGCGKSYLTFILYYYLTEQRHLQVEITGLDLKKKVIEDCNRIAEKYHYDNLHFELGDINGYKTDKPVDMVISLHACDTATDYALYNAISWNAEYILSVPCCQHELNGQIDTDEFGILTRYGILKERTAALMTDAIRANILEYCGYKTQVMEFIDMAHSPKNLLIRAVKANISKEIRMQRIKEVQALSEAFHLEPTLLCLIQQDDKSK